MNVAAKSHLADGISFGGAMDHAGLKDLFLWASDRKRCCAAESQSGY